jgi:hypothetical protein
MPILKSNGAFHSDRAEGYDPPGFENTESGNFILETPL